LDVKIPPTSEARSSRVSKIPHARGGALGGNPVDNFEAKGEYQMERKKEIILAIAVLAFAALACQTLLGGGATPTASSTVLLSDDFSTVRWGTGTDADSSIEYANNALQMIVYTQNYFVWSTPDAANYQNVHLESTVLNNGTDSTTAFGIICNKQGSTSSFNYLVITPAGEYAIARATEGQSDVFLTNNDQWGVSDLITKNAGSYRVGADCGNGNLTLYVDGQQVASAADSTYTSGGVALMVWSGEEATTTDVSFDDFLMTQLP
jgi:hypothetical protein